MKASATFHAFNQSGVLKPPLHENRKTGQKQKAHVAFIWHVGFEAEIQKELRFGSTSGQMSVADSNSRLPRYNNRSGKSCACFVRLRGGESDVNPGSVRKIG
jgi:hypothetical protein